MLRHALGHAALDTGSVARSSATGWVACEEYPSLVRWHSFPLTVQSTWQRPCSSQPFFAFFLLRLWPLCFGPPPKNAPAWHPRELLADTKCAQSTHCTYAIVSVFEAVVLWKWKRHIGRENLTNPHCLREVFPDNFFAGCNEKIPPFEYGYPGSPNTIF